MSAAHILLYLYDNNIIIKCEFKPLPDRGRFLALEQRTARLTILVDPRKKAVFERLCAEEDSTPSQVVRRLLRAYIEERTGTPWQPEDTESGRAETAADRPSKTRRG